MELQVIEKTLITEPIKDLFTQVEANVDTFEIILPKMYGKIDLSGFNFKMRGASAKDTIAEQVLVTSVIGDSIVILWTVTSDFTAVEGKLSLELVGVDSNGDEIIKFTSDDIVIKRGLAGNYAPPAGAIEQALAQMQIAIAKATAEADRAGTYVGKSAYEIWLSEGNSGTVMDFLASLKGENGADGLGLKLLGSFDTLTALQSAYPDGGSLNGGFMVGNEYYYWNIITSSWSDGGSLRGAKGDKGDTGARGDNGKAAIITDKIASSAIIAVTDNTEYQYSTLNFLSVSFPCSDFSAFICFSSGATATAVNFPTGTKFIGDDVIEGVFSPIANKRYSLGLWFDGINNTVVAGGYQ